MQPGVGWTHLLKQSLKYCPSTLLKTKTELFCHCALYKSSRILPMYVQTRLWGSFKLTPNNMDNFQKVKFNCYMLWPYTKFHADGYCSSFHVWHDVCSSSSGIPWSILWTVVYFLAREGTSRVTWVGGVPWLFHVSLSNSAIQTFISFPCYFAALGFVILI